MKRSSWRCYLLADTGPGDHKGWWSRDTLLGQYRLVAGGSSAHWATANTTTEIIYCSWSSCLPIWNNGGVHLICFNMPGLSPPPHWYTVQLPTLQWQCWWGGGAGVYFVFTLGIETSPSTDMIKLQPLTQKANCSGNISPAHGCD